MGQVILFLTVGLSSLGQAATPRVEFPSDLNKWVVCELPGSNSDQYWLAQADFDHQWVVTPGGKTPNVALFDRSKKPESPLPFEVKPGEIPGDFGGERTFAKVEDGWLVSFNQGEFGGELWWFSPDGRKRTKVSKANISGFILARPGLLLTLEGIAHGSLDRGKLSHVFRDKEGKWSSETFVELGSAPYAAVKEVDGSLIVVTSKGLLRVDPVAKKTELCLDYRWGSFYPTSMAIGPSGTVYVGMRHGVARVEKVGTIYKGSWLLPNQAIADQKREPGFR